MVGKFRDRNFIFIFIFIFIFGGREEYKKHFSGPRTASHAYAHYGFEDSQFNNNGYRTSFFGMLSTLLGYVPKVDVQQHDSGRWTALEVKFPGSFMHA